MTQNLKNKVYFPELDIIKGIAILLVIYGHSFCSFPVDIRSMLPENMYLAVTRFHMQLFFLASGFLFTSQGTWKEFLKKKAIRIIVPYIAFCCFGAFLRFIAAPFTRSQLHENLFLVILNGTHYWFLHTLFFLYVIAKLGNGNKWGYGILLFLSIILKCVLPEGNWSSILGCGYIIYFTGWFIAGYFLRDIYSMISPFLKKWWMILFWGLISITCILWANQCFFVSSYVYPLFCCLFVWSIALLLTNTKVPSQCCTYFGKYSLQYYVNHHLISLGAYYVPYFLHLTNPILCLCSVFITQLFIAWLMLVVEDTNNITRFISGLSLKTEKI